MPFTWSSHVHDAPASSDWIDNDIIPFWNVAEPAPQVEPTNETNDNPAGSVSVIVMFARASGFAAGFVTVNVKLVVAFSAIVVGLKALAITGGPSTLSVAVATPPVPPSVEVTLPVTLFFVPADTAVTLTLKVHGVIAGSDAPERLMT